MEKDSIWKESFGYVYSSNDEFEQDFGKQTMVKINSSPYPIPSGMGKIKKTRLDNVPTGPNDLL
jgi:hypothetical protein